MRNGFLAFGLAFLIAGCAGEPTEQIQQAEAAIAKAVQEEASRWAPEDFAKAQDKMDEAKRLLEAGEYTQAVPLLMEAAELAAAAGTAADQAKRQAEEEERLAEQQRAEAEKARTIEKTTHTVVRGESLWIISGDDKVYGDSYQWPKIYQANRDQIQNPDLIYPDQVLTIPR